MTKVEFCIWKRSDKKWRRHTNFQIEIMNFNLKDDMNEVKNQDNSMSITEASQIISISQKKFNLF